MTSVFTRARIQTASIACAVLAVFFTIAMPAFADDKKPAAGIVKKEEAPKPGTHEATEAAAKKAEDAYNEYQKSCWGGTDKEKSDALEAYDSAMLALNNAILNELENVKEVREANDNYNHYAKKFQDPKLGVDAHEQARKDTDAAAKKYMDAKREARKKIEEALHSKFHYEEPPKCKPPDEKTKKKKHKGDTSGGLDFLGNVTIGVGVGGEHDGHRKARHDSRDRDREDEDTNDRHDDKHENTSHGSGCGRGASHTPDQHDKDDDKHGHDDDDDR